MHAAIYIKLIPDNMLSRGPYSVSSMISIVVMMIIGTILNILQASAGYQWSEQLTI